MFTKSWHWPLVPNHEFFHLMNWQTPKHTKFSTFLKNLLNWMCQESRIWFSDISATFQVPRWLYSAPWNIKSWSPASYMHLHEQNLGFIYIITRCTKKPHTQVQQEVGHVDSQVRLFCLFCHFQASYFNELLLQIRSVSSSDLDDAFTYIIPGGRGSRLLLWTNNSL